MAEEWSGVKAPQIDHETMLKLARGARIAELMPYAEDVVVKELERETLKAFKKLEAGTLTHVEAFNTLSTMYAYRKVLQRFDRVAKEAQALGETLNEETDNG